MLKYLIMIDNDNNELNKLKSIISSDAKKNNIEIISICTNENEKELIEFVKNEIQSLVNKHDSSHKIVKFHIVVDACLLQEEELLSSIKDIDDLSGIQCLYEISEYFKTTTYDFNLSLMSRFFAQQLNNFKRLQEFKSDERNRFLAIIKKPILDSGEIDEGASSATDYTEVLPPKYLSKNHLTAFKNILFYKFMGV